MKFLVDAQLPPGLCRWLENRGHAALHVSELWEEPPRDSEISDYAEKESVAVISKDADFVQLRLPNRFVLVWLRCGNVSKLRLSGWLDDQWEDVERRLEAGTRFIILI